MITSVGNNFFIKNYYISFSPCISVKHCIDLPLLVSKSDFNETVWVKKINWTSNNPQTCTL